MTVREFSDIDTQEYIFDFEKANCASQKELDEIFIEISDHMGEFSKIMGIEKFDQWAEVWLMGDLMVFLNFLNSIIFIDFKS